MEGDRVDKSEYKQVVEKEKKKLLVQVIVMTVISAVVAGAFYGVLLSSGAPTAWKTALNMIIYIYFLSH